MYLTIGITLGLCLFSFWCYRRGLKDGLALGQGKPIQPVKLPKIPSLKQQEDKIAQGFQNILAYDGSSQEKEK